MSARDGVLARLALTLGAFTLDVDLALPGRGVSVLFGRSGCGKTTLLRCLAGLQRVPDARVFVGGECWQDGRQALPAHRRAVGMVFQEPSLFPHLSVRGNLEYGRRRLGTAERGRAGTALDAAVELLGIGALLGRRPETLSGGERQRVAIARALAVQPRLLLMDEPLAALDAGRKAEILPYLERLPREWALPIVYVTHAPAELARLADHVVLLEAGRVSAQGALHELGARLDHALAHDDEAGVVLACRVGARDGAWHLARMDFDGGALWTRDAGHAVGAQLRIRVLARDVSLALADRHDSSIANQLPGTLLALADDVHPAQQLALVQVGGERVLARLTRRSAARLALAPGMALWVQVKTVALLI